MATKDLHLGQTIWKQKLVWKSLIYQIAHRRLKLLSPYHKKLLEKTGDYNTKVTTTTDALGIQADIVVFSLVRNNPERNVGAAGTL